jgi:hypothetical protein
MEQPAKCAGGQNHGASCHIRVFAKSYAFLLREVIFPVFLIAVTQFNS